MTKFNNLFNSLINENENENVYMPGTKNTASSKEEIHRQIESYIQELQQSENFDQTVQDVIETAVMLFRGRGKDWPLVLFANLKQSLPKPVFERFLTTVIEGNMDSRLKSEFINTVLPALAKVLSN